MARKNKVTPEERIQIIQYIREGRVTSEIVRLTGRSQSTISRILKNKIQSITTKNKSITGRKITDLIVLYVQQSGKWRFVVKWGANFSLQRFIEERDLTISRQALDRALGGKNIRPKKLKKKPALTDLHRQKRLDFIKKKHFTK